MVKKLFFIFFIFLSTSLLNAGDKFGQCLILKTTKEDRAGLAKWVYFAMSAHPVLSNKNISLQELEETDKQVANLFTRLMTKDCKNELINTNNPRAIEMGFSVLGEVAMEEIMQDEVVSDRMQNFTNYIDEKDFESIFE